MKDKVALVTGANKGIGCEIARQLGERGFHVFVGARNADAGKQATASLRKGGASVEFVEIDVSDRASSPGSSQGRGRQDQSHDVLVNNAGIMEHEQGVTEVDDGTLLRALTTNTLGPLRVTQAFLPLLMKSPRASVINISNGLGQSNDMGGPNAPRIVQQRADTVTWLATEAPRNLTGQFLRDGNVIPW